MTPEDLRRRFADNNQEHIFADFDALSPDEQAALAADCASVDFAWLAARLKEMESGGSTENGQISPAPVIRLPQTEEEISAEKSALAAGEEALRAGKVAAFLVAGGQGTRLGFDGPKGCFPIGPVTEKTLFQWHAEQILARAKKYGTTIPWYIMTSRANHDDTVKYFKENEYLGFAPDDVMFFQQAMVPSVSLSGKLLLADKAALAMNPDGHGGSLTALVKSGAIADMQKRGIATISYFQVDNPLVTIADPVFVGYHLQAGAEMSSKVLKKANPTEKVGNICYCNGELTVIEYSDLSDEDANSTDENGALRFWAGSIAIHMLDVEFVGKAGGELPWHIANKKVPFYANGTIIEPEEPNAVKFETFVFDALPMTSSSITMEVAREEEFAPVKNASGVDSADSCRQLLANRSARWLAACGHHVELDADGNTTAEIEISPRHALDAEELRAALPADFAVSKQTVLE